MTNKSKTRTRRERTRINASFDPSDIARIDIVIDGTELSRSAYVRQATISKLNAERVLGKESGVQS